MSTSDDNDFLTGTVPDPDAEPTAAERAHAKTFADLVDKTLSGRTPPAMSADDRALLEVATVILPRLGDTASAEDVLRDTLATAVEKIKRFSWQGKSIYPWLRQIAINKVYDVHRQAKRSRKLADAMVHEVAVESDPDTHADAQLIADQERRAHKERIAETLALLTERYRIAIELRLIEELSREDCAKRLGITVGTFDVLLFRAVRAFRKQFGETP